MAHKQICISISIEHINWMKENLISPSRLMKQAINREIEKREKN